MKALTTGPNNFLSRFLGIVICLFIFNAYHGQLNIDNQKRELDKAETDTTKIRLLNELALSSSRENLEYSLLLLDSAFYRSFLINDNQRIGDTYLSKGLIYLTLNADSSKRYLDKAAEYFILINDKRRLANYYSLLGDWSQKQKLNI